MSYMFRSYSTVELSVFKNKIFKWANEIVTLSKIGGLKVYIDNTEIHFVCL